MNRLMHILTPSVLRERREADLILALGEPQVLLTVHAAGDGRGTLGAPTTMSVTLIRPLRSVTRKAHAPCRHPVAYAATRVSQASFPARPPPLAAAPREDPQRRARHRQGHHAGDEARGLLLISMKVVAQIMKQFSTYPMAASSSRTF